MSYILDALKRAAEQRNGPPPEVRRLLAPAPVAAPTSARYVAIIAAAAGAIAVAAIVWMWPGPTHDTPTPIKAVASPAPAPAATPATSQPPAPPAKSVASAVAVPAPIAGTRADKPRAASVEPRAPSPKLRAAAETRSPRTTPLAVSPPPVAIASPPLVASLPQTAAPAAPRIDVAKLKLEVIVYSDQRPQRWAFINGRKYLEGDAIGDGARVEEIHSSGVVLVEDGRRFTLRP